MREEPIILRKLDVREREREREGGGVKKEILQNIQSHICLVSREFKDRGLRKEIWSLKLETGNWLLFL